MEGRRPTAEIVKPIFKAGLPLALSASNFACGRVISRAHSLSKFPSIEEEEKKAVPSLSTEESKIQVIQQVPKEEILDLISQFDNTQNRITNLEAIFLQYCDLKEQESFLHELELKLEKDMNTIEDITMELSSQEAAMRTIIEVEGVVEKALETTEISKAESGCLRRKAKNLSCKLKRLKHGKSPIKRWDLKEQRKNRIKALESENQRLRDTMDQLKLEKSQLMNNHKLVERSSPPVPETRVDVGEKNMDVRELQWGEGCLRYMVEKNEENKESNLQMKTQLEVCLRMKESEDAFRYHVGRTSPSVLHNGHSGSRAEKLFTTMAKWVSRSGSDSKCKTRKKLEGDYYGCQAVPEFSPVRMGRRSI